MCEKECKEFLKIFFLSYGKISLRIEIWRELEVQIVQGKMQRIFCVISWFVLLL